MPAIELLVGNVTAPGTTLTATTPASGNSFTIRNTAQEANIMLLNAWTFNQTAGVLRIRAPELHDNVENIRVNAEANQVQPLLPYSVLQKFFPQIDIAVELSGSGTAGDIETAALLVYYDSLPGVEARLIGADDLKTRTVNIVSVENNITNGTSGGYSGEEALNAEFDLLKANTDYAILGNIVDNPQAAVRYRGSDFGNLGIGIPADNNNPDITKEFFVHLAMRSGLSTIPVFNSANVDGMLVDIAGNENAQATKITTILAQLT